MSLNHILLVIYAISLNPASGITKSQGNNKTTAHIPQTAPTEHLKNLTEEVEVAVNAL